MKKILYSLLLLLGISTQAQNDQIQDTKGTFEISSTGQATYTLPIALPPSLKNVAPSINLIYSSGNRVALLAKAGTSTAFRLLPE